VLAGHVDQNAAVVAAVDRGAEDARGVAADLAGEDDLHVVRSADFQVASDQGLEEAAAVPRASKTMVQEISTCRIEISHQ
jgi:hypothetical protein